MIDIESELFSEIAKALRKEYKKINIYGEEIRTPPQFPCVCIVEIDNYPLTKTQDSASNENHVTVVYEVNVYSNKANGKKTEAKEIFSFIDNHFLTLGFNRTMMNPITTENATIYRIIARYRANVSTNKIIYAR